MKYQPKLYQARNQLRRGQVETVINPFSPLTKRRTLHEMLAEAAANTAAIKTDDAEATQ